MSLQDKLDEIKNRAEEATPGPWKTLFKGSGVYVGNWSKPHCQKEIHVPHEGAIELDTYNHRFDGGNCEDTAEFIAHARTDIPKLLAVIEKLIEQREKYAELLIGSAVDEESDNAELEKLLGDET